MLAGNNNNNNKRHCCNSYFSLDFSSTQKYTFEVKIVRSKIGLKLGMGRYMVSLNLQDEINCMLGYWEKNLADSLDEFVCVVLDNS